MKRNIGDKVVINPYTRTTGVIHQIINKIKMTNLTFDYVVKLNIPDISDETVYTANYNSEEDFWWQYFSDNELDILEKNWNMVTKSDNN
ncbi:hypothetical protein [Bacillus sp. AG4(2022)]|uniref:hypothetical protein n=1 Tax=Bacillus sp. AG4(2022) TaxID=2962594 RepID=UPI0028817CBE|nr:hypothetical protein [Bacillus sp. AG4(2022)]MDT0160343.1 hypothetical protein [Bacillus sp. AG4(2022)]